MESKACIYRWDYPVINLQRCESRSCCRVQPREKSFSEIETEKEGTFLNASYECQMRLEMIKGKLPSDCHSCQTLEDQGFESSRPPVDLIVKYWESQPESSRELAKFKTTQGHIQWEKLAAEVNESSPLVKSQKPRMLEISLGNLCDLKCIYCSHHYSSAWASELRQFKQIDDGEYARIQKTYTADFDAYFWKWFQETAGPNLSELNILGGEPLINPGFYKFVEKASAHFEAVGNKNVTLSLVTNLNLPPIYLKKFLETLPKLTKAFRKVDLNISMESYGARAEYIRSGLDWERWVSNLDQVLKVREDNLTLSLQMAINALSVTSLKDYLEFILPRYEGKIPFYARKNVVTMPEGLSPLILPKTFARYLHEAADVVARYQKSLDSQVSWIGGRWDLYEKFLRDLAVSIQHGKQNHNGMLHFYRLTGDLDRKRQTDVLQVFPEYKSFWDDCQLLHVLDSEASGLLES